MRSGAIDYTELNSMDPPTWSKKGIDFILDPMGAKVSDDLFERINGIESFVASDPPLLETETSNNSTPAVP